MSEKLAAFDEFHDKVDSEIVLEDILHVHDEGMIHLEEDVFLQLYVLKLLILHYDVFSDTFHGKNLLVLLILDEINFSKGSLAYHPEYQKIL